jgi:hypothetical protein
MKEARRTEGVNKGAMFLIVFRGRREANNAQPNSLEIS